ELTSVGYHLAVVGITQPIAWRQPLARAVADAHARGGVVIRAHPSGAAFRRYLTNDGLRAVDGIEVAHPGKDVSTAIGRDFIDVYRRAMTLNPGVAAIGSSDFHFFAPVGFCRTYLFV